MAAGKICAGAVLLTGLIVGLGPGIVAQDGASAPPARGKHQPLVDVYGDPLPDGAIARMGTVRWHHHDNISRIALSPDGKMAVTAGGDRAIWVLRLWDLETGKQIRQWIGYGGVAFSPDGKTIASGETNPAPAVRIRETASGNEIVALRGFKKAVGGVIYSPDGKNLATQADENSTFLWDPATGTLRHQLLGKYPVFSPDGTEIATTDQDSRSASGIYFWDVKTGKQRHFLKKAYTWWPGSMISVDGKNIVTGQPGGPVFWFDRATGKEIRQMEGDLLASSPKGDMLAIQDKKGLHLCNVFEGKNQLSIPRRVVWASNAVFSLDGKTLAVVDGTTIRQFDTETGKELRAVPGHSWAIPFVAFSPDTKQLVTAGDFTMRFWDVPTGKELRQLQCDPNGVKPGALSADGRTVVLQLADSSLSFRDIRSGQEVRHFPPPKNCPQWFAVSPDLNRIAKVRIGDGFQRINLFDAGTGQRLTQLVDPANQEKDFASVHAMAFAPDCKTFAALSNKIILWQLTTGKRLPPVQGPALGSFAGVSGNQSIAFSPNAKILATGCKDNDVGLWEVASGRPITQFKGHSGPVWVVAFGRDGKVLASGSQDGTVRLWEVPTGRQLHVFKGHRASIRSLAFSRDNRLLACGCVDGTALVWDVCGLTVKPALGTLKLSSKEIETLWSDMQSQDPAKAYAGIMKLVAGPTDSIPFLLKQLGNANRVHKQLILTEQRIEQLIADLDNEGFVVREHACAELERRGLGGRKNTQSSAS